jgi:hypothetical protein
MEATADVITWPTVPIRQLDDMPLPKSGMTFLSEFARNSTFN